MQRVIVNPVLKETVTFTTTALESGGAISDLKLTLMPGGGNPLHTHASYAETLTALDGRLSLGGTRTIVLAPGQSHLVEKGQVHRFFNATDRQIRFRDEVRPGHTGSRTRSGSSRASRRTGSTTSAGQSRRASSTWPWSA